MSAVAFILTLSLLFRIRALDLSFSLSKCRSGLLSKIKLYCNNQRQHKPIYEPMIFFRNNLFNNPSIIPDQRPPLYETGSENQSQIPLWLTSDMPELVVTEVESGGKLTEIVESFSFSINEIGLHRAMELKSSVIAERVSLRNRDDSIFEEKLTISSDMIQLLEDAELFQTDHGTVHKISLDVGEFMKHVTIDNATDNCPVFFGGGRDQNFPFRGNNNNQSVSFDSSLMEKMDALVRNNRAIPAEHTETMPRKDAVSRKSLSLRKGRSRFNPSILSIAELSSSEISENLFVTFIVVFGMSLATIVFDRLSVSILAAAKILWARLRSVVSKVLHF